MSMSCQKRYLNSSLDNYICDNDGQKKLIKYLSECLKNGFKENIVISGSVGTGKTHLCYAIINYLEKIKEGKNFYTSENVYYTTIKEMIDKMRKLWKEDADKYDVLDVNKLKEIPLLIIDEVGVQYGTNSERIEMFEIFNSRYNDCLPTIAVTNLDRDQVGNILGERIEDRLYGGAKIFNILGKSRR